MYAAGVPPTRRRTRSRWLTATMRTRATIAAATTIVTILRSGATGIVIASSERTPVPNVGSLMPDDQDVPDEVGARVATGAVDSEARARLDVVDHARTTIGRGRTRSDGDAVGRRQGRERDARGIAVGGAAGRGLRTTGVLTGADLDRRDRGDVRGRADLDAGLVHPEDARAVHVQIQQAARVAGARVHVDAGAGRPERDRERLARCRVRQTRRADAHHHTGGGAVGGDAERTA